MRMRGALATMRKLPPALVFDPSFLPAAKRQITK